MYSPAAPVKSLAEVGCLTERGVVTWNAEIGIVRAESFTDVILESSQGLMRRFWQEVKENLLSFLQGTQGSKGITDHGFSIEAGRRLIEYGESFREVGIEFKKLVDLLLGHIIG